MRDLDLPNRLVMAPMESNLASADGSVSETQIEYYRVRAAGGVGMVIVEYTCVDRPQGLGGEPQLGLDTDDLIASHACLVKTVHAEGSRIAVQLFHAGRQTHPKFTGGLQPIAASSIPCPMYRKMPREMTVDDMVAVAQKFKQAAQRAARAGYDAVEIHGAHGYLLANFLSAASNKRTDAFGGSLENRQKFPLMIATAVREGAGDLPVIFRLSADEFVEGGTRIDEACDTARKLVDAGVDVLHVSTGCHERIDRNVDPIWMPEGWRIPFARQIREAAGAPVIAVGVIRRPEMAEHAIENGSADFIALGRALLADPEWPKKARAGKVSDIRPCTSCNWCVAQIGTGHTPVGCAENPRAGRENHPFPVHVAGGPTAVVVGSGPGGIAAALTLDHAGYHVILMERHSFVASGLMASAAAPKKDKFHWYRDYLLRKLDSSGVDVQLNCEATADAIAGIDPTIVIEATGARDRILTDIEGLDQPHVKSAYDVLAGNDGIGEGPIVIYGAGEVGCEAAKFAAEKGFDVVLATRSADKDALSRANPLRIFRERFVETIRAYPNIRVELGVKLQSIRADRVVVVQDGEENTWKAGTILMAVGRLPNSHLALELEERGIRALVIGDASEVRRIGDAVHEAYSAIRDITLQAAPGGEPLKSLAI
jgi:2,4-dienoyl-CoA reductase-like NADH-dependent reductase (Old Yellow Enzyme family)/thioredoxin reductase